MSAEWTKYLFGHGRLPRYVPFVLCTAGILLLSTTEASMANTSRFVRPLLEYLFPDASEPTLQLYHNYIRKFAHVFEYAALAFIAARAFKLSSKSYLKNLWPMTAMIAVLTVASMDELNQSLNSARTGSIYDVLLDLAGGLLGVAVFCLFSLLWSGQTKSDAKGSSSNDSKT